MPDVSWCEQTACCVWTVGNKDDMNTKVVQPIDARRLADQVGIPFFETSAKENKNVEEVGLMGESTTSDALMSK